MPNTSEARPTLPGIGLFTAPVRLAAASTRKAVNATVSIVGGAVGTALVAGETATRLGKTVTGSSPDVGALARAATGLAVEVCGGPPSRRVSASGPRRWIEVRGLDGETSAAIGSAVLEALRETPGVRAAFLNSAAARVVVTVEASGPSSSHLCAVVAEAERGSDATVGRAAPASCPATMRC